MKFVRIINGERMNTRQILQKVLKEPELVRGAGVDHAEMLIRLQLLDKIDETPEDADGFEFEDDQWKTLCKIARTYHFYIVDQELADIIQNVLDAKKPEKLTLVPKDDAV